MCASTRSTQHPASSKSWCRAEVERLLTEQDQIEYVLGFDPSTDPDSRRWSGMA
jgi:hypothetical protein